MAVSELELDRKTFDLIQSNLASNGHEAAAGYMVKMAIDFRNSFTTRKVNLSTCGGKFTESDIQRLINEINETAK